MTISTGSPNDSATLLGLLEAEQRRRQSYRRFDWRGRECPWHSLEEPYIDGKCLHGRPNQILPTGDWRLWLVKAGRGWGKTRVGAEAVREWSESYSRIGLIAPTGDDAREIMVEGESGVLAIFPNDRRARYIGNRRRIEFPSGSIGTIYTADEPERLRGPQHTKLWMDEIAAWRYLEMAFDMAMLGLRLGNRPQAVLTTTPKPLRLVRDLRDRSRLELGSDPLGRVIMTEGSSFENAANLAPAFLSEIVQKYQGTRLGRQELHAEIIEDVPGALWKRDMIVYEREPKIEKAGAVVPNLARIVVAIDPAVTSGEESNETGIIVAGLGHDRRGYVLDDVTVRGSPTEWAGAALEALGRYGGDRIVAEANQGGDMILTVIAAVDRNAPVTLVHASRGKRTRAEPIAALYEQGRVLHVRPFPELEDQMCVYTGAPGEESPDRLDALVWALSELFGVQLDGKTWGTGGAVWGS